MKGVMDASITYAKHLATALSHCNERYIIHIALKELGVPSSQDGFSLAKEVILILYENRLSKLCNDVYSDVGTTAKPPMDDAQVCQAISRVIKKAWEERNQRIWRCFFPKGSPGYDKCPTNRDFLFAIVDFVELWQGCCEEVNYAIE